MVEIVTRTGKTEKSKSSHFVPAIELKEDFKLYLAKTGVIEQFSKGMKTCIVLVRLYREETRPVNAIDYIKRFFGNPSGHDIKVLRGELHDLKEENKRLKVTIHKLSAENDRLKDDIYDLEIA